MQTAFATEQVRRAYEAQALVLDLSWCDLDATFDVREVLGRLKQLEVLDLSGNGRLDLPQDWSFLPNLRRLVLRAMHLRHPPMVPELVLDWSETERLRAELPAESVVGLDLACALDAVPTDLTRYRNLSELSVICVTDPRTHQAPGGTSLKRLTGLLRGLARLRRLEFFNCGLETLPDLSPLAATLETLSIKGGAMRKIAPQVRDLPVLTHLELLDLGLVQVPAWIFEHPRLVQLSLAYNRIATLHIPDAPSPALESLRLSHNQLTSLAAPFQRLTELRVLDLECNPLSRLDADLRHLAKLEYLDLSMRAARSVTWSRLETPIKHVTTSPGQLRVLPPGIGMLPRLRHLDVAEQPLVSPPQDVVAHGLEAMRAFWQAQMPAPPQSTPAAQPHATPASADASQAPSREPAFDDPSGPFEVFLSYAWKGDVELVEELATHLSAHRIQLVRDREVMRYKDSINRFTTKLGQGRAVVVVLSAAYLRSKHCMYELIQVAKHQSFKERVFPIVLDDAGIFDPMSRLDVIEYWENKIARLDTRLKRLESSHLASIQAELSLYRDIRTFVDRLVDVLGDMYTLAPAAHRSTGFAELAQAIHTTVKSRA